MENLSNIRFRDTLTLYYILEQASDVIGDNILLVNELQTSAVPQSALKLIDIKKLGSLTDRNSTPKYYSLFCLKESDTSDAPSLSFLGYSCQNP